MEQLIATIEKGKPFFNAIARNKYLKAIRDGFISVIPIIIFSSIFILVDAVPNVWDFYWPAEIDAILMKAYNYSMGILALGAAATTAKHFCDAQNRDMPKNNQINFLSVMIASVIGFLLLSSDAINVEVDSTSYSGFANGFLGSKGLLTAFISAFVVGIVYKFFVSRNITIKLPDQVPPNISQTFKDLIPFSVSISIFWLFDLIFRSAFGFCFAQGVIQVFQPLFSAADSYVGLAIIYGAMSLFWFVGVHGPSIVEPAISAALVANMSANLTAYQAGEQATHVLPFFPVLRRLPWRHRRYPGHLLHVRLPRQVQRDEGDWTRLHDPHALQRQRAVPVRRPHGLEPHLLCPLCLRPHLQHLGS